MGITWALYAALGFYLSSAFCYLGALRAAGNRLERAGLCLLVIGFFVHLVALLLRYFVVGYTPITSLHESLPFLPSAWRGFSSS